MFTGPWAILDPYPYHEPPTGSDANMIHDFAKTPRSPSAEPRSIRQKSQPTPRRIPRGRWIALILLALALGSYGMWVVFSDFVDNNASTPIHELPPQTTNAQPEKPQVTPTQKVSRAPGRSEASPQETAEQEPEFGFYKSLTDSDWRVPVQHGVYVTEDDLKRQKQRHILQAASLRDQGEAQRLVQHLRQKGLQAFYNQDESGGWYRVNVGPFDNLSKLNKAEDILVAEGMKPLKKKL